MERVSEGRLAALALDGVVVWAACVAAGVDRAALRHQVDEGRLVPVARGVWRLRDHPADRRHGIRLALALAGPGSVVGLRTAARLHGLYRYRSSGELEVLVRRAASHRRSTGRIVQTRELPDEHVTQLEGFAVTTLARTYFDLCGDPDPGLSLRHPVHERRMLRVYDDALARRGLSFTHEVAVFFALAKRGRSGTALVRRILEATGPSYVPTASELEGLFLELVRSMTVLPEPARQVALSDSEGFIGVVDFVWFAARVVVEIDSSWHDGMLDRRSDEERDRRLRALGYRVLRYRYGRLVLDATAVMRELGDVVAAYTATTSPRTAVG